MINNQYAPFMKAWPKGMGAKPTAAQLATASTLAKPASKVAFALALYLRDGGATQGQVVQACGGPQLNKMRELITQGKLARLPTANNEAGHTVYAVALGTGKPAKAKRKASAKRKAKGAAKPQGEAEAVKVEAPTSDAAPQG